MRAISRFARGIVRDTSAAAAALPTSRPVAASVFKSEKYQTRASDRSGDFPISIFHGPTSPSVARHFSSSGFDFRQNGSWRRTLPDALSFAKSFSRSSSVGRAIAFFCASGTSATTSPPPGAMGSIAAKHGVAAGRSINETEEKMIFIFMRKSIPILPREHK